LKIILKRDFLLLTLKTARFYTRWGVPARWLDNLKNPAARWRLSQDALAFVPVE
jgi:hypothetical protein